MKRMRAGVVLLMTMTAAHSVDGRQAAFPALVGGGMPLGTFNADTIDGTTTIDLLLAIVDGRVIRVSPSDESRRDIRVRSIVFDLVSVVSRWQFAPGTSTELSLSVTYELSDERSCDQQNRVVEANVPTRIVIKNVRGLVLCHETAIIDDSPIITTRLGGLVKCDCASGEPIRSARISATPVKGSELWGTFEETTQSDNDGRFSIKELPPGKYAVAVQARGYTPKQFTADIRPGSIEADPILFRLPRAEGGRTSGSGPIVVSAAIPVYPLLARAQRIEGDVTVRVKASGSRITDIQAFGAPEILANAAIESVRSWGFSGTVGDFDVLVRFSKADGCGTSNEVLVRMAFPGRVDVIATLPCRSQEPNSRRE